MAPLLENEPASSQSRGLSNLVGFLIVITMILSSVIIVAGLGATALDDTMDQSGQNLAEHTMTLLDSRAAMVALGDSDSQSIDFNQNDGTVETRPNMGRITIKHINYDPGNTETVFDEPLGALVYTNGDTEIAYQGGGVWRQQEGSDARMLSPPEFHYRGSTLTLPVVRVTGDSESATSSRAIIQQTRETVRIFPSDSEYGGTSETYQNPIENGRIEIKISSPFYEGWAQYARQRTTATVDTYESNETTRLVLESLGGSPGGFEVPLEGDAIAVDGLGNGHPITNFTLELAADGHFQNAHWSLYSTTNGDEFEMHIYSPSKCSGGSYDGNIDFSLYYYNESQNEVREWQNTDITPGPNAAFDIDCAEEELHVNFTNANTKLTYRDIETSGSNNKWCFGEHIADREVPQKFGMTHHPDVDPTSDFEENSSSATTNFTVNHYMSRLGTDYQLTVTDGAGNSECLSTGEGRGSSNVDESASSGNFEFKESGEAKYLTYLHVTENRIEISLD